MIEPEAGETASSNHLPEKSRKLYVANYDKFIRWQQSKKTKSFSENVLLAYFHMLSEKYKASSLWAQYSMLKCTIAANNNVDIKSYSKLLTFLRKQSVGFKSKKSKTLTTEDVERYLYEAPDQKYLATKVALIFGIMGACRREELSQIKIGDIKDIESSMYLVKLPLTRPRIIRTFTITNDFYSIVKKYKSVRPLNCKCDRFFLNYQFGKCTQQPIGINKFGNMPKEIAKYLKLEDPDSYTGHSFRKTSATLLGKAGTDITTLKRPGGWESNRIVEVYLEESIIDDNEISDPIGQSMNLDMQEDTEDSDDDKSNIFDTHFDILDELPSEILGTSETKGNIICKIEPQPENSTTTEQNFDSSSEINIPHENFNSTTIQTVDDKNNILTHLDNVEESPSEILETSETRGNILCEIEPQPRNSTTTEQNSDLSSKINIPHKNFNSTTIQIDKDKNNTSTHIDIVEVPPSKILKTYERRGNISCESEPQPRNSTTKEQNFDSSFKINIPHKNFNSTIQPDDDKNNTSTHFDIVEVLPSKIPKTSEGRGNISCESEPQPGNSTTTEQNFDSSSKINIPHENFNSTTIQTDNDINNTSIHFDIVEKSPSKILETSKTKENISCDIEAQPGNSTETEQNFNLSSKIKIPHKNFNLMTIQTDGDKNNILTHFDIVEEPPSKILKTSERKGNISCEIEPQPGNSTTTEQNFDLSSKINIPHKNLHLTVSNCSNVVFNFYTK